MRYLIGGKALYKADSCEWFSISLEGRKEETDGSD
jgi:hypothetical protein